MKRPMTSMSRISIEMCGVSSGVAPVVVKPSLRPVPVPVPTIFPGLVFLPVLVGSQIAVSPTSHDLFVADEKKFAVKAFAEDGEEAKFTAGPGAGTNELFGFVPCGVAVDANGDIYVADANGGPEFTGAVVVYAPSGEELTSIATSLSVQSRGRLARRGLR